MPKLVRNNQWNLSSPEVQQNGRQSTIVEACPQTTSGQVRNTGDEAFVRYSEQTPEYRMPPLYGEEQSSNHSQQNSLQTHSNKFPVCAFLYFLSHSSMEISKLLRFLTIFYVRSFSTLSVNTLALYAIYLYTQT